MLKLYTKAQARLAAVKDRGATAVEYGLIVALIAAVIVVIVATLGDEIKNMFDDTCDAIAQKSQASGSNCNAG